MRVVLIVFLSAIATGLIWFLSEINKDATTNALPKDGIVVTLQVDLPSLKANQSIGTKDGSKKQPIEATDKTENACFIWGPFSEKQLVGVRLNLQRQGLIERMVLSDRHLPDRWIVYLGPFSNATAVKAFSKQFRQQGYKNIRPIYEGALAYGVEIESFVKREDAESYIVNKKAPDISGIKVTNRLGGPSGDVDLVFRNVTPEQIQWLLSQTKKYPDKHLQACNVYEKASEDSLGR